MVAAGILTSRLSGLARSSVVAHFLGNGPVASVWTAAFRIPNLLQNLFGEGALSASFIPVYAGLEARGSREEARRLAGAVAALLGLVVTGLVVIGVVATPLLIDLIAPGFTGDMRELTIRLVRIAFPGTGVLVLSAWCLGVLNSHHRFFLPYAAPVAWNVAIIAAFFLARTDELSRLAEIAMWGAVAGSVLQLAVQLPTVTRLLGGIRLSLRERSPALATVIRNFLPISLARGITQVSAYVDTLLATLISATAVASLGYAQLLSTLPVSLFGMSVSAAELPAMAAVQGTDGEIAAQLRARLDAGLRRIAYFVVPSAVAFIAIGHLLAAVVFQSGRFTADDSVTVWSILAASGVGLLAGTLGRLYSSSFYALRDTRTPVRYAVARVGVGVLLGWLLGLVVPRALGIEPRWATAGLALGASLAAWLEFSLLRRGMNRRIGATGLDATSTARLAGAALAAAGAAWLLQLALPGLGRLQGLAAAATFGAVYVMTTLALGVPEARTLLRRSIR
ncbi:MAG TPA: murein biosynthesis integral membrane protein MurJ [Gemmatimonadales bacterium]|nr:murein biosynthesis integral membrane protein MurJ [Gemmatimonadales bacterium]